MKIMKKIAAVTIAAAALFAFAGCAGESEDENGMLSVSGKKCSIDYTNEKPENYSRAFETLKTKHFDAVCKIESTVNLAKEDAKWYMENRESVSVYDNGWISICLWRRLPNNYDEDKIRNKYTKVYQDLRGEILYLVSEFDCSTFDKRRIANENLQKYIEERFGIEEIYE